MLKVRTFLFFDILKYFYSFTEEKVRALGPEPVTEFFPSVQVKIGE